ncbi:MAG TPA: hypothetical protein VK989_11430 [Polyangia bacterium]|nr:hypothetical protein [Polyangia bacterium]
MRFLDVLDTGDDCAVGTGNLDDEFDVALTDGTMDSARRTSVPSPRSTPCAPA